MADDDMEDLDEPLSPVGQWLVEALSVSRRMAADYAQNLEAKGYDQLDFIALGEFSRRRLVKDYGIPSKTAPALLRAIQVRG